MSPDNFLDKMNLKYGKGDGELKRNADRSSLVSKSPYPSRPFVSEMTPEQLLERQFELERKNLQPEGTPTDNELPVNPDEGIIFVQGSMRPPDPGNKGRNRRRKSLFQNSRILLSHKQNYIWQVSSRADFVSTAP
jgi:hypothetical protein